MRFKNQSVPPQFRLFDNYKFDDLTFWHIKINNKFIEPLSLRIINFIYDGGYNSFEGRRITKELPNAPIMSLSEWEQYLKEQE